MFGIKILGLANGTRCYVEGQWVQDYQPDAFQGRGDATMTPHPRCAKRFATAVDAMRFAVQQPKGRPLREDGLPNRPLMAFTMTVEPLP